MTPIYIVDPETRWHVSYLSWLHGMNVHLLMTIHVSFDEVPMSPRPLILIALTEREWKMKEKLHVVPGGPVIGLIGDVRNEAGFKRRARQAKRMGAAFVPRSAGGERFRCEVMALMLGMFADERRHARGAPSEGHELLIRQLLPRASQRRPAARVNRVGQSNRDPDAGMQARYAAETEIPRPESDQIIDGVLREVNRRFRPEHD